MFIIWAFKAVFNDFMSYEYHNCCRDEGVDDNIYSEFYYVNV